MYSNAYIFRFAAIMVITVAAVLATVATVLKPFQEKNKKIEKIQEILAAAEIKSTKADAIQTYEKHLVKELMVNFDGDVVSEYQDGEILKGDKRAFNVNMKTLKNRLKEYKAGKTEQSPHLPVFILDKQNEQLYVIPIRGKGLWGPVWGNIALQSDLKTIKGATFDHKGETPGLGAEINTDWFEDQFKGKKIFEDGKFTSIRVVKGGIENSPVDAIHGVDGISGGTITSNGVDQMLETGLKNYLPFFNQVNPKLQQ
ncbi:MAG: NADH:ubiquinone reductase (Na(+)-transporting) subunit C [Bacteroidales bacterium]|nr:NADH:ubiquinone reductase (Na(+)-transporting) subunit C [Bacteroidales bacterium]